MTQLLQPMPGPGASIEPLETAGLAMRGAISDIAGGRVQGWFSCLPGSRLPRVVALIDGDIKGFGELTRLPPPTAELDEFAQTFAFTCAIPASCLHQDSLVTILVDHDDEIRLIGERSVAAPFAPPPPAASSAALTIHFDITDLLVWLTHHRQVSGIQRVQCGLLMNALAEAPEGIGIRVCAQLPDSGRYIELPAEAVAGLLHDLHARLDWSMPAWRDHIIALQAEAGRMPDFAPGDILLTTGAPWVNGDYYQAIERLKRERGVRYFQIFYDMIPIVVPEVASSLVAGFARSAAGMLWYADHILSISDWSARDLAAVCDAASIACPPVSLVPLGATLDYRTDAHHPGPRPAAAKLPEGVPAAGKFVLCVGTIEPRKNHLYLYRIWKKLLAEHGPEVPKLVCVGRLGWDIEELQRSLQVTDHLDGHFMILSDVSDSELDLLYRDCLFTVFPSVYEGWGLPVTETLFYRKLCVTSNVTSMLEAGGDWVEYVDPGNVHDGYAKIAALINDPAIIARAEARLRAEYAPLTWRRATQGLLADLARLNDVTAPRRAPGRLNAIVPGTTYAIAAVPPTGTPLAKLMAATASLAAASLLDGADWHTHEDWGCWSSGMVARLRFRLADAEFGDLVCHVSVQVPFYAAGQSVRACVNGHAAGCFHPIADAIVTLKIDIPSAAAPTDGSGEYRLELHLEQLIEPPFDHGDQRLLGIGVSTFFVCAADDLAARLAWFERSPAMLLADRACPPR